MSLPLPTRPAGAGRVDRWLVAALLLALFALIAAAALAFEHHTILAYTDTTSHLIIPRRVFDNRDVGLPQLGVHWGPLFHVLQFPLVVFDDLYHSGASGTIVSAALGLLTAFFVYRLAVEVGASRTVAFTAVLMLIAAPSFLYVNVVPMTYSTVMATATGSIYFLTRWAISGRGLSLVGAGLMLTLATLAHFDTWILWPLELGVVVLVEWRNRAERAEVEATALLWAAAGTFGLLTFVLMNVAIFGDPLAFLSSFKAAAAQPIPCATGSPVGDSGRSLGTIIASVSYYPRAAALLAGLPLAIGGGAGAVLYTWHRRRDFRHLVPLLLFYPLIFYCLWSGVRGGLIAPGPTTASWTNLRYANTLFPALAFFLAVGLKWWPVRAIAAVAVVAVAVVAVLGGTVAAWEEARQGHKEKGQITDGAEWLAVRAGGDAILVADDHFHVDRLEVTSGLPSSVFVDRNDTGMWRRARRDPSVVDARWIVWVGYRRTESLQRTLDAAGPTELCYYRGIQPVWIYAVADPADYPNGAAPGQICRDSGAIGDAGALFEATTAPGYTRADDRRAEEAARNRLAQGMGSKRCSAKPGRDSERRTGMQRERQQRQGRR